MFPFVPTVSSGVQATVFGYPPKQTSKSALSNTRLKLKVNEGAVSARSSKSLSHTVVVGDTLSQIAEKHGIKTADLKRWNGIKTDTIRLGQVLRISSR